MSFVRAVRVVMILAILFMGWAMVDLFRGVFVADDPLPVPTNEVANPGGTAGPAILGTPALADGGWSVGESGWSLKRAEVESSVLGTRLASLGEPLPTDRATSPLENEILEWLRSGGASSTTVEGGVRVYSLSLRKAQIRLVSQPLNGFERIRLMQLIWTASPTTFNVFEVIPAPPTHGTGAVPPMLPIPAGASIVARRWSGNKVIAELVGPLAGDAPEPSEWTEAGWVGKPIVIENPEEGQSEAAFTTYTKGSESVEVWRVSPPVKSVTYLLITRPPAENRR